MTRNERMKKALESSRMSKEDFALCLGVSIHTINSWLKNPSNVSSRQVQEPTVRFAETLAKDTPKAPDA
jgi:DNA-binding transcriptional regulator YiaG